MKKALLTIAAIALFAAPASAQVYSLWADAEMTSCGAPMGGMFNVYVFCEPGPEGCFGGEYRFVDVPLHFNLSTTPNPVLSAATIGAWYGGDGITYGTTACQAAPFWVCNMQMLDNDGVTTPVMYYLEANAASGIFGVTSCIEPGRPIFEATLYNHFGVHTDCVVGTEESSWGAIKSMMD
jgi:hypothetical protein